MLKMTLWLLFLALKAIKVGRWSKLQHYHKKTVMIVKDNTRWFMVTLPLMATF